MASWSHNLSCLSPTRWRPAAWPSRARGTSSTFVRLDPRYRTQRNRYQPRDTGTRAYGLSGYCCGGSCGSRTKQWWVGRGKGCRTGGRRRCRYDVGLGGHRKRYLDLSSMIHLTSHFEDLVDRISLGDRLWAPTVIYCSLLLIALSVR
jgi:hypothetical protein